MTGLATFALSVTKPYRDSQMQAGITQLTGAEIVLSSLIQSENLRKEFKLTVPERAEPLVTSIQNNMADKVAIRHEPELKGAFKALQQKGLRIKDYKEDRIINIDKIANTAT